MSLLHNINRAIRFFLTSLNAVVGVIVGSVFGALVSILVMAGVGDGFSFSGNWLWYLTPGALLGAYAGIKIWPLATCESALQAGTLFIFNPQFIVTATR